MKIDRVRSDCSKTEENAIKLHASPNSRTIFISSGYHELIELDLRILLYFSPENFISNPFSHIVRLCDFCADYAMDAARGQLCEIAPAHNITSPVLNIKY